MLTSKERAELRAQANTLETTLIVGKSGVTDTVIGEAENQLTARELVKGKVLEGALMSPREVSDAICEATGADGVAVIGTKFVIYRFSEKLQEERNQSGRAKRKAVSVAKSNPVRKGAKARRQAARTQREQRNEYFRQQAIERAIEREREKQLRKEQ
jgi:RNA-binding protein